jgi:hypothetical protein
MLGNADKSISCLRRAQGVIQKEITNIKKKMLSPSNQSCTWNCRLRNADPGAVSKRDESKTFH